MKHNITTEKESTTEMHVGVSRGHAAQILRRRRIQKAKDSVKTYVRHKYKNTKY